MVHRLANHAETRCQLVIIQPGWNYAQLLAKGPSRDALVARIDALAADADDLKAQLDQLRKASLGAAERSSLTAPLLGMLQYDSNTEALLQAQLPLLQAQVDYVENVEASPDVEVDRVVNFDHRSGRVEFHPAPRRGRQLSPYQAIVRGPAAG